MDTRKKLATVSPDGFKLVTQLDEYCGNSIDPTLRDLISLRASLINGRAASVDMHTHILQSAGMQVHKIYAVGSWRDSTYFSDVERMVLELTEEISRAGGGVSEELWERARRVFSEQELGDLVIAIGTIELWSRLGIVPNIEPTRLHC